MSIIPQQNWTKRDNNKLMAQETKVKRKEKKRQPAGFTIEKPSIQGCMSPKENRTLTQTLAECLEWDFIVKVTSSKDHSEINPVESGQ